MLFLDLHCPVCPAHYPCSFEVDNTHVPFIRWHCRTCGWTSDGANLTIADHAVSIAGGKPEKTNMALKFELDQCRELSIGESKLIYEMRAHFREINRLTIWALLYGHKKETLEKIDVLCKDYLYTQDEAQGGE